MLLTDQLGAVHKLPPLLQFEQKLKESITAIRFIALSNLLPLISLLRGFGPGFRLVGYVMVRYMSFGLGDLDNI